MDIPRYRIGNDLTVLWAICNNDGTPFDLSGKGVRLFVTNERGMTEVVPTITTDKNGSITNVILWTFLGNNQKVLGKHTLTVEIVTADDKRVIKRDISDAFNLVARSEGEESGGEANAVDSGTIYLSTKLDVYRFGNARVEIGTNGNWFIDGYDTGRTALAGEPGIVHNIYTESDLGKEFDPDSKIDTFNAHAINAINNALKRMTLEQLQDLSLADLEEYDVLAYNGNAWLNVPFRDLLNIFKGPSESSSGIGDGLWYPNEQDGKIHTDHGIVVHGDAIFEGDTSSEGDGEDVVVGIQGVRVNGTTHYDEDGDGVVDLGTIESGGGGLTSVSWGDIQGTPPSVSTFNNDVPYVTDEDLKPLGEEVETLSTLLSSMWHLDENGNLVTDKQVIIKNSLISEDDTSSGGEGQDTPSAGLDEDQLQDYLDLHKYITEDALSSYYTKAESDARYLALSGGTIDGSVRSPLTINTTHSLGAILPLCHKSSEVAAFGHIPKSATSMYGTFLVNSEAKIGLLLSHDGVAYLTKDSDSLTKDYTIIHSGNIGSYKAGGLATARNIWGQSFDGTGDVDGSFVTNSDSWTMMVNTSHEIISYQASGKYLNIGYSTASDNYSTYINGYNLYLRYGANATTGITLNSLGNVLIGTSTDSGYKLDVNGTARISGAVTMSSTLSVGGNITIQPTATSDVSLLFVTGNLNDGYYDYKIGKFTDKNSVGGFGMAMANASAQWTKFLSLSTDGNYNVTSVNILTNLVVSGDVASA